MIQRPKPLFKTYSEKSWFHSKLIYSVPTHHFHSLFVYHTQVCLVFLHNVYNVLHPPFQSLTNVFRQSNCYNRNLLHSLSVYVCGCMGLWSCALHGWTLIFLIKHLFIYLFLLLSNYSCLHFLPMDINFISQSLIVTKNVTLTKLAQVFFFFIF